MQTPRWVMRRPRSSKPLSHRPCAQKAAACLLVVASRLHTRAVHLVRILAIVPHIIGARAEPVIVTLLQGCKRLSVVISYLRASIDDDFFPQRCFYVVESILVIDWPCMYKYRTAVTFLINQSHFEGTSPPVRQAVWDPAPVIQGRNTDMICTDDSADA